MANEAAASSTVSLEMAKSYTEEAEKDSSNFDIFYKEIYRRTVERNEELSAKGEDEYVKFLKALHGAFFSHFNYYNLLGKDPQTKEPVRDGSKDRHVDYTYLVYSRMGEPVASPQGGMLFASQNGAIKAHGNKLEFISGREPAPEGKQGKIKKFALDDAYNLVLLAMQDRHMMPPHKMKFHGTAPERALLHYAATQINTLLPEGEKILLKDKNAPFVMFGMNKALKNDPFNIMVAEIYDNLPIQPKKVEPKPATNTAQQNSSKGNSPDNGQTPDPSSTGPKNPGGGGNSATKEDKNIDPATVAAASSPDGASGAGISATDHIKDAPTAEDKGNTHEESVDQTGDTSIDDEIDIPATPDDADRSTEREPTEEPSTQLPAHDKSRLDIAASIAAKEEKNSSGTASEDISPIVSELEQQISLPIQTDAAASAPVDDHNTARAQKIVHHAQNLVENLEKMFAGQSANDAIATIIENYEKQEALDHNPEYAEEILQNLEDKKLVVRDPNTGEALFRGLATFKDRNLDEDARTDYNAIATDILNRPDNFLNMGMEDFSNAVKNAIENDNLLETKGYGYKLPATARQDIANGMTNRIMGYLQEDNVVQLDNTGRISFIAKSNAPLTRHFHQAAQQQPQASQPAAPAQNYAVQSVPVNTQSWAVSQDMLDLFTQRAAPAPKPDVSAPVQRRSVTDHDAAAAIEGNSTRTRTPQSPEPATQVEPQTNVKPLIDRLAAITKQIDGKPLTDEEARRIDEVLDQRTLDTYDFDKGVNKHIDDIFNVPLVPHLQNAQEETPKMMPRDTLRAMLMQAAHTPAAQAFKEPHTLESLTDELNAIILEGETSALEASLQRAEERNPSDSRHLSSAAPLPRLQAAQ